MNEELKHINSDLHTLNDKLQESNQVKEEYIGYVFNMCSLYINKQEEQRKMLARKIKTGNWMICIRLSIPLLLLPMS